jgi:basic membrane protein A
MSRHKFFGIAAVICAVCIAAVVMLITAGCEEEQATTTSPGQTETTEGGGSDLAGMTVAINTIGSRTDGSWSQAMFEAYETCKEQYPEVTFTFSDLVPYSDFPALLAQQAQAGVNLIYADSAWYDAVKSVAADYPETWFVMPELIEADLEGLPDNCATWNSKYEEKLFLAGVVAGMTTNTKKVGVVLGEIGYSDVTNLGYAFLAGARYANPDVTFAVGVTGDWVDIQKGYDAANAVLDAGVDVMLTNTDNGNLGALQAVQDRNTADKPLYLVGEARDMSDLAPEIYITSYIQPHAVFVGEALKAIANGTMSNKVTRMGLKEGLVNVVPPTNVSQAAKDKLAEVEAAILDGSLVPEVVTDTSTLEEFVVSAPAE